MSQDSKINTCVPTNAKQSYHRLLMLRVLKTSLHLVVLWIGLHLSATTAQIITCLHFYYLNSTTQIQIIVTIIITFDNNINER